MFFKTLRYRLARASRNIIMHYFTKVIQVPLLYKRALNLLKNDMCIVEIGQVVLELF